MFTGIVDHCGEITEIERVSTVVHLRIKHAWGMLTRGESVAVDGICLTVTDADDVSFCCDVSIETQRLTCCSTYTMGTSVHLERALRMGDRLGGHWVTGHVDATLTVVRIDWQGDCCCLVFDGFSTAARAWLIGKGSVAINGVSLTLNVVNDQEFHLMLIPETVAKTQLAGLKPGDRVNVEYDTLAKIVAHQVSVVKTHA